MGNFKQSEFKCKCCREAKMQEEFMISLQKARTAAGVPFKITSGFRCKKHNAVVGGAPGSSHTLGWAADIACSDSPTRWKIVSALIEAGFTRIGIGKGFIHCDCDPTKPTCVVWVY